MTTLKERKQQLALNKLKQCTICNEEFPATTKYFYKNKSNSNDGLYPYCKECTKKKTRKWQEDNAEHFREIHNKWTREAYMNDPNRKEYVKSYVKQQRENGYYQQYQQENKDKFKEYRKLRRMNKSHDITEDEWLDCLDYFDYTCAYCGMSEEDSIAVFGQVLHKEHVDHNGSNDISNNIPACKGCNSKKWEHEFNEWYNENNPVYERSRYNRIIEWLMSFASE